MLLDLLSLFCLKQLADQFGCGVIYDSVGGSKMLYLQSCTVANAVFLFLRCLFLIWSTSSRIVVEEIGIGALLTIKLFRI